MLFYPRGGVVTLEIPLPKDCYGLIQAKVASPHTLPGLEGVQVEVQCKVRVSV